MGAAKNNPYKTNPFTPVFGKVPAYLAGREQIISEMIAAFDFAGANPDLCSIFVGARGTGKTSLLTYLASEAKQYGWISVNVTSSPGMLDDILQRSAEVGAHLLAKQENRKLNGFEIASIGGLSWDNTSEAKANWRTAMNQILDQLAQTDTGIVITVDEVDPSQEEVVNLVTTYQHFVREDRKVALLMAGLPHNVSKLLSGKSTSFLRRATRHDLGSIPAYEVEEAFKLTVEKGGRSIKQDALESAVRAIDGFPYLFQLVGYRSWNAAGESLTLTSKDVEQGIRLASEEFKSKIFAETLAELSKADMALARAIAAEGESARRESVMKRLGKSSSHISTYKKRLLEAGVIEEPQRGVFKFALPGLGTYIKEQEL